MGFQIAGKLVKKYDVESKTASFQTREFVIQTEEQYPQFVKFQSVQDRVNIIDQYQEGDRINVSFDLRGREWQEKYFTNLNAWKVDKAGEASGAAAPAGGKVVSEANEPDPFATETNFDDLPF